MGTFVLPELKLNAKGLAQVKMMNIPGGIASCAGVTENGWYAASLIISDDHLHSQDDGPLDPDLDFEERGDLLQKWLKEQQETCPARLVLTTSWQSEGHQELACERSILFPVSPKEKTNSPVVVFVSRDAQQWHLNLLHKGKLSKLCSSRNSIRYPSVVSLRDELLISYEQDQGNEGHIFLVNAKGKPMYQTLGRRAKLVIAEGQVALMKERCTSDSIITCIELIDNTKLKKTWDLPLEDDYTFNGDICFDK